jgi:hypothetical protein
LHTSSESQDQMEGWFFLDVVVTFWWILLGVSIAQNWSGIHFEFFFNGF